MPFVTDARPFIQRAFREHYAMPAFNVCSLEMARACIEAAEEEGAPVMLQTYPGDLEQAPPDVMAAMIKALAEEASVPIILHLDHGDSLERIVRCLRAGYASVMFDGADYPLEENVRRTKRLSELAHAAGAALEAAAGSFGGGEGGDEDVHLTEPEVAARVLQEGEADMVACSVGSRHGQSSKLDLDRLRAIAEAAGKPLVLHGGTGIPASDVAEAVELGVVKVNIGAGILRPLLKVWSNEAPNAKMHYEVYQAARDAVREAARDKIRVTKAAGKA